MKKPLFIAACLLALGSAGGAASTPTPAALSEVVVTLSSPSLASAYRSRPLAYGAASRGKKLDLRAATSRSYLERLAATQLAVSRRIESAVPAANVRWRYRIVANGLAVSLPSDEISALRELPGVEHVYPSYSYRSLDASVPVDVSAIGAPELWKPDLSSSGQGIKIGIIDDGVDQRSPYFNPTQFAYPAGFPKGDSAFTTAKVIAARSFAPAGLDYANASLPVDPKLTSHGSYVAGIAAGNANTLATVFGKARTLSGVAPGAYLGNYKALSIPTEEFGLNGNSPEIVAAIEAAVSDGMQVLNLSIGEPEIDPRNDIVARAVNAASAAGVVVVAAAGNEYGENGLGSISSPGTAAGAIAVGASSTTTMASGKVGIASFSSSGPTSYGLALKPDVTAPGIEVASANSPGGAAWDVASGTSAAAPHVAGAAALLRQLHPSWTPVQIKSALVLTGTQMASASGHEISPLRAGGGRIALQAADQPLVFASPSSVGFGLVKRREKATRTVQITAAGAAVGSCSIGVTRSDSTPGASLRVPSTVSVPGTLTIEARATAKARAGNLDGWIVLNCAGQPRRIPFWLRVSVPALGRKTTAKIVRAGVYKGNTSKRSALVTRYLYPERAPGVPSVLNGPEQVFRFPLKKTVENFGVVVVSHDPGVRVSPRIVRGINEDRLAGLAALPANVNPYLETFGDPEPVAGALRPTRGLYSIVFDTTSRSNAGCFRFRLWINDRTAPRIRLLSRTAKTVRVRITDGGSGVDPHSIVATAGARSLRVSFDARSGKAKIKLGSLKAGGHTLAITAADYQETKNNENALALLPNTRTLQIPITVG